MTDVIETDFIIVGGGSAGCVLANRLSADGAQVLLIEAGGRDSDPWIKIPLVWMRKFVDEGLHDWGYKSGPEPFADNRLIECVRARVLGGCSSVNAMGYVRGSPGDYDRWASKGLPGWSFADILPYFKRCESWEGGEDAYRGGSGPLHVRTGSYDDPLLEPVLTASAAAGLPTTPDYNGAQNIGVGKSQQTIKDGRRWSAADAFLRPALSRSNLKLQLNALVTRIVIRDGRAVGVRYEANGQEVEARAGREVILSAGAINSPQLLMLSGIGPADHLREHSIQVVHDASGVGENLQDHIASGVDYERTQSGLFRDTLRADRVAVNIPRAYLTGTGPATDFPGGLNGFAKTNPSEVVPDIQLLYSFVPRFAHVWFPGIKPAWVDSFGCRAVLLHPESRGKVELASPDPKERVRLRQNFFAVDADLAKLRKGIRYTNDIFMQSVLDRHRGAARLSPAEVADDDALNAHIRKTCTTVHHPCGTCRMGSDEGAVVDGSLKLRGIDNLRVVDASVMPDLVSGNIHAAVLMIAEKAADLILGKSPPSPVTVGGTP